MFYKDRALSADYIMTRLMVENLFASPSVAPTITPTSNPSNNPTALPSKNPSFSPTKSPTPFSSNNPSLSPTKSPSLNPSPPPTAPNTPPIVFQQIPTTYATVGKRFEFIIPAETFTDADGDSLSLTATLPDGSVLPPWLNFYPHTWEFLGVPTVEDVDHLQIKVTASDEHRGEVSEVFFLVVTEETDTSITPSPNLEPTEEKEAPNTIDRRNFVIILSGMFVGGCILVSGIVVVFIYLYKKRERYERVQQEQVEIQERQLANSNTLPNTSTQQNGEHINNVSQSTALPVVTTVTYTKNPSEQSPIQIGIDGQSDSDDLFPTKVNENNT